MKDGLKQKPRDDAALKAVAEKYAVRVTAAVLDTIDPSDPADPVARQYIPDTRELVTTPEELLDPTGDKTHEAVKGVIHRYPDRVLLKPVHACAVYCRFCFRREQVGPEGEALSPAELETALGYIRDNKNIWEVILTGGDPLILSPRRLAAIMKALEEIEHVRVIRLHTRIPVADPARVTGDLIAALDSEKAVYVAVHVNHANELTAPAAEALRKFTRAGIPLLSQTVLLNGVNNNSETLDALFRRLVELRVKPYYLHHPDPAPGTSHFRLSLDEGRVIVKDLRRGLSGIALPRYVVDIPGGFGKVLAEEGEVEKDGDDYVATDRKGGRHRC